MDDVVVVVVAAAVVEFSILAELGLTIGTFVFGIGLLTKGVELSGTAEDGNDDGDGKADGDGKGAGASDGGIDDCSGNGAKGTFDEYGGFTLLAIGACATVGCSLLANGTATVVVMGSPAAMAILFKNNFKYIAKIRLNN